MIHLSKAVPADVDGIAAVVRAVWDQDILPDVCRAQMESDTCALWVAQEEGGNILGFISAFITADHAGERRWEVDLVAVTPSRQGQGIGRRLIARACEDRAAGGAALARALIGVDNVASQRAFHNAGFGTDHRIYELLLWPPERATEPESCPATVSLVPVDTVTYRGLWIEGLAGLTRAEQRSVVRTARAQVARGNRLNTGAAVRADSGLARDLRDEATLQGEYLWYGRKGKRCA